MVKTPVVLPVEVVPDMVMVAPEGGTKAPNTPPEATRICNPETIELTCRFPSVSFKNRPMLKEYVPTGCAENSFIRKLKLGNVSEVEVPDAYWVANVAMPVPLLLNKIRVLFVAVAKPAEFTEKVRVPINTLFAVVLLVVDTP